MCLLFIVHHWKFPGLPSCSEAVWLPVSILDHSSGLLHRCLLFHLRAFLHGLPPAHHQRDLQTGTPASETTAPKLICHCAVTNMRQRGDAGKLDKHTLIRLWLTISIWSTWDVTRDASMVQMPLASCFSSGSFWWSCQPGRVLSVCICLKYTRVLKGCVR